jgi:trans-aconitate methyltransferase
MKDWLWSNAEYSTRFLDQGVLRAIVDALRISNAMTVLDFGCGDGTLTEEVAKQVVNGLVVGCDRNVAAVREATRRLGGRGNTVVRRTSAPWRDFPSLRYDVVLCRNVLHFNLRYRETLSKLVGLTNPGGSVYVETPVARSSIERRFLMRMSSRWQPDVWRHYPVASYLRSLFNLLGDSSDGGDFCVLRSFPRERQVPPELVPFVLSHTSKTTCYSVLYMRSVLRRRTP